MLLHLAKLLTLGALSKPVPQDQSGLDAFGCTADQKCSLARSHCSALYTEKSDFKIHPVI